MKRSIRSLGALLALALAMLAAPAAADTGYSGLFTIDLRTGPLPIAGLTFTAPVSGATLEAGLTSMISWSYTGATPNAEVDLALVEPGGTVTHPIAKTTLGASAAAKMGAKFGGGREPVWGGVPVGAEAPGEGEIWSD